MAQLENVATLAMGSLPFLLLFSAFIFLNAEMWQVANDFTLPYFSMVVLLVFGVGSSFVVVSVRRLTLDLTRWLTRRMETLVFEPNDMMLKIKILMALEKHLNERYASGALVGTVPAEAFTMSGKPTASAAARTASASSGCESSAPGTSGTPEASTVRRALSLSPMARIALAGGPTKAMPSASSAATRSAFSARKP